MRPAARPTRASSCNNFVKLGTLRRVRATASARDSSRPATTRASNTAPTGRTFSAARTPKIRPTRWRSSTPAQLARLLLPLGESRQSDDRATARRLGSAGARQDRIAGHLLRRGRRLPRRARARRPRHQRAGRRDRATRRAPRRARGIAHYTVGQRAGLPAGAGGPRYVTRIDAATEHDRRSAAKTSCSPASSRPTRCNLIRPERFARAKRRVRAMIRYRAGPSPAARIVARTDACGCASTAAARDRAGPARRTVGSGDRRSAWRRDYNRVTRRGCAGSSLTSISKHVRPAPWRQYRSGHAVTPFGVCSSLSLV